MVKVGPYEFSDHDVERTLFHGRTLFDLLPGGFPAAAVGPAAPFRARAEAVLDGVAATDPVAALEVVWESWFGAVAALRASGAFGPAAVGTVTGLFTGDGGVPKHQREEIDVSWSGALGDRQADRKNHGKPWQALCLWSSEIVADLAAGGHPIVPGCAGENISITGLAWERVVPGVHLRLGDVLAVVSSYAIPCKTTANCFVDGHFDVMHHRHGPVSRVYATVVEPGVLRHGDAVLLEPPA